VVSYNSNEIKKLCEEINNLGFGLTLGIHSRIDQVINYVTKVCNIGNIYVNRNIVGAVVGVQPFGGQGLSGTGPKAGGPHYLSRLCHEHSVSNNTTAMGGNASLLTSISD
ncbi:MAG: aldehyde dehydrogenase family protein, partial [Proteobacteria bacterium]|nr:aldehyde dehydrogenase family protein [Pseudomonadota bacterium]